jgi:sulfite exporter TauE/SafE
MGLTGSFTAVTAHIAGIQKGAMIFAGLLIVAMGVLMSGWVPMHAIFKASPNLEGFLSKGFRKLTRAKSAATYYPIGLLLGLLPCGPVYTVLIASARAGMEAKTTLQGFAGGMALMIAFGIGTVPALLTVGKLADLGWLKKRDMIYKLGAVIMILVGIYFVVKGVRY